MNAKNMFLLVLTLASLLAFGLLVMELSEEECEKNEIKYRGECCRDSDSNRICDSLQLSVIQDTQQSVENIGYSLEMQKLQEQINKIESQKIEYRNMYEATRNERDFYYREYHEDRYDDIDIKIIVRDNEGRRLEDAYVKIENGDTDIEYTDEDGEVKFYNMHEDCYEITVRKDGYETERKEKCIDEDKTFSIYLDEELD